VRVNLRARLQGGREEGREGGRGRCERQSVFMRREGESSTSLPPCLPPYLLFILGRVLAVVPRPPTLLKNMWKIRKHQ
jgi:hypothetical protein